MDASRTDGPDARRPSARASPPRPAGGPLAADAPDGARAHGDSAGHDDEGRVRPLGRGEVIVIVGPAADVSACARDHGFVVVEVATAAAAIEQVEAEPPHCAIVVAQLLGHAPADLAQALRRAAPRAWFPVVLLEPSAQARDHDEPRHDEFDDVLAHDEGPRRLVLRLRSLVRLKHKHDSMGGQTRVLLSRNTALAQELRVRNEELERLTVGLVGALEKANLLNDEDTGNHIRRVCHFSRLLAERARLGGELTDKIFRYASLHDVGKVGIPDAILKKRGALTQQEFEVMKRHTVIGFELLEAAGVDEVAKNIALAHHEKFDGGGYPRGLRGDAIPIEARIVAVADVFDALTTERCYKQAFPLEKALGILEDGAGRHFDPAIVAQFLGALDDVMVIQATYQG